MPDSPSVNLWRPGAAPFYDGQFAKLKLLQESNSLMHQWYLLASRLWNLPAWLTRDWLDLIMLSTDVLSLNLICLWVCFFLVKKRITCKGKSMLAVLKILLLWTRITISPLNVKNDLLFGLGFFLCYIFTAFLSSPGWERLPVTCGWWTYNWHRMKYTCC